jgi:uncharacterized protein YbjT (DUF2867 family)
MRTAVAGGTGVVGRLVVDRLVVDCLSPAGHQPVALARSTAVDLTTGEGLEERLTDV